MKNRKHKIYGFIARGHKVWNTWKHDIKWWQLLEAIETTFDSCVRSFYVYQDEWTLVWGEILPYKLFISSWVLVALCTIFSAHQIFVFISYWVLLHAKYWIIQCSSNFCKKNFRKVDIFTKITKIFCYENLEPYSINFNIPSRMLIKIYFAKKPRLHNSICAFWEGKELLLCNFTKFRLYKLEIPPLHGSYHPILHNSIITRDID